ncbi:MAG: sulfatase [bacterium]|nr:sulfatase [bacterium]
MRVRRLVPVLFSFVLSVALLASFPACHGDDGATVEPPAVEGTRLERFRARAAEHLERNAALFDRLEDFDAARTLAALDVHPANGFVWRLDDRLAEARRIEEPDRAESSAVEPGLAPLVLRPDASEYAHDGDVLRIDYRKGDALTTAGPIDVPIERVAALELRLKTRSIRRMEWAWSADREASLGKREDARVAILDVDTTPDGAFHTYRIHLRDLLRKRVPAGGRIRRVWLRPSLDRDDDLEIASVRWVSVQERYAAAPTGVSDEEIALERRRVLHTGAGVTLEYDLALPPTPTRLRTGLAVHDSSAPIRFGVDVLEGGQATGLVDAMVADRAGWRDVDVSLARWAGKDVTLRLRTEGASGGVGFWSAPTVSTSPRAPMHVIVLLQDTLRADHLSTYGYARETTPGLDAYARGGAVFEYGYAQATKTRPSVPSLMTGLFPTTTGVWDFTQRLDEGHVTLAEVLRRQGFATAAFVPNGNAGPFSGIDQGFDHLFQDYPIATGEGAPRERNVFGVSPSTDDVIGPTLDRWIARHADRNTFLYIHVVDPHGPYDPPAPHDAWFRDLEEGSEPETPDVVRHDPEWIASPTRAGRRARYDGEIRNNDEVIARFLERLEASGRLANTLMVFVSDHGEHLGEHDLWEHHPPGFVQVLHVPIVFGWPGRIPAGQRIRASAGLIDVMPTILDLLEVPREALPLQGRSWASTLRGGARETPVDDIVVSDEVIGRAAEDARPWGSVFFEGHHVLSSIRLKGDARRVDADPEAGEKVRVFDVRSDPRETAPVETPEARALAREAMSFLAEFQAGNQEVARRLVGRDERTIELDPETQARLRAMGYLVD